MIINLRFLIFWDEPMVGDDREIRLSLTNLLCGVENDVNQGFQAIVSRYAIGNVLRDSERFRISDFAGPCCRLSKFDNK